MKVLLTGGSGQLGRELLATVPEGFEVVSPPRAEFNITRPKRVRATVERLRPDLVVNAAAYTAVDRAEDEPEVACSINATGVRNLATAAHAVGARFIHLSTDFVFSGERNRPYRPEDTPSPLGVYGTSKWKGEEEARKATGGSAVIIRTSWLYSRFGKNFVKTMVELMRERREVSVVADQTGSPTWARGLARVVWRFAERPDIAGTFHWTDDGATTWFGFAEAISKEAFDLGLIPELAAVTPIASADYDTAAERPTYSALDSCSTSKALIWEATAWRSALREMLTDWKGNGID